MASSSDVRVHSDSDSESDVSETAAELAWDDWEADEADLAAVATQCPLCAHVLPTAADALSHLAADHAWDVQAMRRQWSLDYYGYIRLVNFARRNSRAPTDADREALLADEELLIPVLEGDPLLFDVDADDEDDEDAAETKTAAAQDQQQTDADWRARAEAAERRLAELEKAFQSYMELARTSIAALGGATADEARDAATDAALPSTVAAADAATSDAQSALDYYFESYSHFGIHEEMLRDAVRTESYRDFILGNPSLFEGKVVLDVGCGTGILSMFAARSGARHVYAVDASHMADKARAIIAENDLQDRITVIKGRIEQVNLPVDTVDIIVSEWMGYALLYESMLDSVFVARDRWLAPGGLVLPRITTIHLAGLASPAWERRCAAWDDVYGFKMRTMRPLVLVEPAVDAVDADDVMTEAVIVKTIDAHVDSAKDLDYTAPFSMRVERDDLLCGLVCYFDVDFLDGAPKDVRFSTSPAAPLTHWKQTTFYLSSSRKVSAGDMLTGEISMVKHPKNPRALKVTLRIDFADGPFHQSYDML